MSPAFADASERFVGGLSQIAHYINTTTPVARQVLAARPSRTACILVAVQPYIQQVF
jgi:hypothetical protein